MNLRLFPLLAVVGSVASAVAELPAQTSSVFWSGTSATYHVIWSASDLLVTDSGGKTVFSARQVAEQGFRDYQAEMQQDNVGQCTYTRRFRLADWTGVFLTFKDDLDTSCDSEAHPAHLSRYSTIDLSQAFHYQPSEENDFSVGKDTPSGVVSLKDLFQNSVLLKALNSDSILKNALASPAASLDGLREDLGNDGVEAAGKACHFKLADDYLTRFSFHHMEQSRIAVRLELTPIGGACASQTASLGLLLPAPDKLLSSLSLAGKGKEGFLLVNAPERKESTVLTFHTTASRANGRKSIKH